MTDNIDVFEEVIDLATELGCDYQFDPTISPMANGDQSVTSLRVPAARLATFYRHPAILERSREGRLASGIEAAQKRVALTNCAAGFSMAFVDAEGDVYPCIGFPPAFGNVVDGSFADAWKSPEAKRHRMHMQAPLETCLACEIASYCGRRCPRLALAEGGDLSGASPRSCEMADLVKSMGVALSPADTAAICSK
jgi:radical SAM protein with 4Fe4S-binding SPASM domain